MKTMMITILSTILNDESLSGAQNRAAAEHCFGWLFWLHCCLPPHSALPQVGPRTAPGRLEPETETACTQRARPPPCQAGVGEGWEKGEGTSGNLENDDM